MSGHNTRFVELGSKSLPPPSAILAISTIRPVVPVVITIDILGGRIDDQDFRMEILEVVLLIKTSISIHLGSLGYLGAACIHREGMGGYYPLAPHSVERV